MAKTPKHPSKRKAAGKTPKRSVKVVRTASREVPPIATPSLPPGPIVEPFGTPLPASALSDWTPKAFEEFYEESTSSEPESPSPPPPIDPERSSPLRSEPLVLTHPPRPPPAEPPSHNVRLYLQVSEELAAWIKKAAEEEDLPWSSWVRRLLKRAHKTAIAEQARALNTLSQDSDETPGSR